MGIDSDFGDGADRFGRLARGRQDGAEGHFGEVLGGGDARRG